MQEVVLLYVCLYFVCLFFSPRDFFDFLSKIPNKACCALRRLLLFYSCSFEDVVLLFIGLDVVGGWVDRWARGLYLEGMVG